MIKKSLLMWMMIVPLAVLNGALRDLVFAPMMGESCALPLSGITLCLLILLMTYIFIPHLGKGSYRQYWLIGLLWLVSTICFEFILGLWVFHKSLTTLIMAYDIRSGNLWSVVVVFIGVVPILSAKLRKRLN